MEERYIGVDHATGESVGMLVRLDTETQEITHMEKIDWKEHDYIRAGYTDIEFDEAPPREFGPEGQL